MLSTLIRQTTFIALVLASLTSAGPAILPRDDSDDLVTFCFSEDNCFQASAVPAGCVDLPLFSTNFTTATLAAPDTECILSPERGCTGSPFLPPFIFDSGGATFTELAPLGLPTVASFLCTSSTNLVNVCFPDIATEGCFQGSSLPLGGCGGTPRFGEAFATVSLTTAGQSCTLFDDADCNGNSAVIDQAFTNVDIASLGLSTVESWICVDA
ncbi:hypothetical protein C8F01DRAFT_1228089 [Mycena amicta]|nr:hypothetical protein C8F01DRAFT_1228089 [Mycena amicta]